MVLLVIGRDKFTLSNESAKLSKDNTYGFVACLLVFIFKNSDKKLTYFVNHN